ncbi:MAG: FAD-dependent oxidoreductase [Planctomycetota bacterium]|nr:FAD-dependent oxidoreductase [Planctomycetota bacterium]MDA1248432.1 FAD-dependent oxidoreductase [Planctomycetota bacterium]
MPDAGLATGDHFDVAVLGSGFSGSLISWLLQTAGLRTVVIDRARHPRFAIGESSTPAANLILRTLAAEYGLPELAALSRFGTWRETWPGMRCGLKRGFSYFAHRAGEHLNPDRENHNQLLVAASVSDQVGDTHWYRAEVDSFLARRAQEHGAVLLEETEIRSATRRAGCWSFELKRDGLARTIEADFVVDATGAGQALVNCGGVESDPVRLQTSTRSIFAHVRSLPLWSDVLATVDPSSTGQHPFRCDDSAMHHLLEEGWMWWLRFHNGLTSVGFVIDEARKPFDENLTARVEWDELLAKYPSIQNAFRDAELVHPELIRTGKLQRMNRAVAGADWALLPSTAGFVDPLHSTGIAHTLSGVERLTRILTQLPAGPDRNAGLSAYSENVSRELEWIDTLVHGCYECLADFRKFTAFSMCYFAAATTYERRRLDNPRAIEQAFLCADDEQMRQAVTTLSAVSGQMAASDFETLCEEALRPFNHVGLFSPRHRNMYECTALPESSTT